MQFLVFVALGGAFEAVGVAGTFAVTADEGGVEVNVLEPFQIFWLDAFWEVVGSVAHEGLDDLLVVLTDCTEVCWVAFEFFALQI